MSLALYDILLEVLYSLAHVHGVLCTVCVDHCVCVCASAVCVCVR